MNNVFNEIKEEFLLRVGESVENRKRDHHNVELRASLTNAMIPFCHQRNLAEIWEKDRTTIYNYERNHEAYFLTSSNYRVWYATACELVAEKLGDIPPRNVNLAINTEVNTHEQIDSIKRTIEVLQGFLEKLQANLQPSKPRTLQEVREAGLGNDGRHLGDRLVHRVLRDEQLQVSDESGRQAGSGHPEGLGEGQVVREPSETTAG